MQRFGAFAAVLSITAVCSVANAGPLIVDEIETNDTQGTATPLSGTNGVARGSIFGASDQDCFSIPVTNGDRIYAATNTTGSASGTDDSTLTLKDAAFANIEQDLDDGFFNGTSSVIAGAAATSTGVHYLCVTGNTRVHLYDLFWQVRTGVPTTEDEANNDASPGPLSATGGWFTGTLDDNDHFGVNAAAGDTIFVVLDPDPDAAAGFASQIDILGFTGVAAGSAILATGGTDGAAAFVTVHAATTVSFALRTPFGAANAYDLSITVFSDTQPSGSGVTCVTRTSGALNTAFGDAGLNNTITVTGATGRIVDIDVAVDVSHDQVEDLDIFITGPGGANPGLNLFGEFATNTNPMRIRALFDDEAALSVGRYNNDLWIDDVDTDQMNYKPQAPSRLSWLDGTTANGAWILRTDDDDDGGSNDGVLHSWGLRICVIDDPALVCPANTTLTTVFTNNFDSADGVFSASNWVRGAASGQPINACASGNCWVAGALAGPYLDTATANLDGTINLVGYVGAARLTWQQQFQMRDADALAVTMLTSPTGSVVQRIWNWNDGNMRFDSTNTAVDTGIQTQIYDISSSAAAANTLRFSLIPTNDGNTADGWMIDNVSVESCAPQADLVPTLTVDDPSSAGGTLTATLSVNNPSVFDIQTATASLQLPADMTWSGVYTAPPGFTCTGTTTITCSGGASATILASGNSTFTFNINVGLSASGARGFTGSVVPGVYIDAANNTATDSTTVTSAPQADLTINIDDGATTYTPGNNSGNYTITVGNNGPSGIVNGTVAVTFPAAFTSVTWGCVNGANGGVCGSGAGAGNINDTGVDLPNVGSTVVYTANGPLNSNTTGTLTVSGTATPPAGTIDPSPASDDDQNTRAGVSDLSVTYSNPVSQLTPGQAVTYTLVVSNVGPSDATGATVTNTVPASLSNGTWTCSGMSGGSCGAANGAGPINTTANVPVGGTVTYTWSTTVSASPSSPVNTTGSVAHADDTSTGNNSQQDSDPVFFTNANLGIAVTDGQSTFVAGGMRTYTITASNPTGPTGAVDATVFVDFPNTFTVNWTCVGSCTANGSGDINDSTVDLTVGGTAVYTATATLASSAALGTVGVTASITYANDPSTGNNSAVDSNTVDQQVDLVVTYTNNQSSVTENSAQVYILTVTNSGPSDATGVSVSNTVAPFAAASWTCVGSGGASCTGSPGSGAIASSANIPAGASVTYTVNATIGASPSSPVVSSASATHGEETNAGNNTAQDSDPVVNTVANLGVSITNSAITQVPGNMSTYTIVATNPTGPTGVVDATVSTTFPGVFTGIAWTCSGSNGGACAASGSGTINDATVDLPVGGSVTYLATGTLSAAASGTVTVSAGVVAPSGIADSNSANNTASDVDTATPQANLVLAFTNGQMTVTPGAPISYTLTVTNAGPSNAASVNVGTTLPTSLTGVMWTCSGSGGSTCAASGSGSLSEMASITAGESVTYTITGTVDALATGLFAVSASIMSAIDTTSGNNAVTDTDVIASSTPTTGFDLSARVTITPAEPVAGATVVYNIDVSNAGPETATGGVVTITLPAAITVKKLPAECSQTGVTITCTLPDIAAGDSVLITIITVVSPDTAVGVDLSASATTNGSDNTAANDSSSVLASVQSPPSPLDTSGTNGGSGATSGTGATGASGETVDGGTRGGCICRGAGSSIDAAWILAAVALLIRSGQRRRAQRRDRQG